MGERQEDVGYFKRRQIHLGERNGPKEQTVAWNKVCLCPGYGINSNLSLELFFPI
jgi:hypothetical protein